MLPASSSPFSVLGTSNSTWKQKRIFGDKPAWPSFPSHWYDTTFHCEQIFFKRYIFWGVRYRGTQTKNIWKGQDLNVDFSPLELLADRGIKNKFYGAHLLLFLSFSPQPPHSPSPCRVVINPPQAPPSISQGKSHFCQLFPGLPACLLRPCTHPPFLPGWFQANKTVLAIRQRLRERGGEGCGGLQSDLI